MGVYSFAAAGLAGLAVLTGSASPIAAGANARSVAAYDGPARAHAYSGRSSPPRRRPGFSITGCSGSDGTSFVAISGQTDYAGGYTSAVLGGQNNEACDSETAIGGGSFNEIGAGGGQSDSFIGAGYANAIASDYTSIAAGYYNEASGSFSFVGAGLFNYAQGPASFVGAGGQAYNHAGQTEYGGDNIAGGADSFVGAGDLNQIGMTGNGSFIGGGGYSYATDNPGAPGNQIFGPDSFIGAGDQNTITVAQGFIGSGQKNTIAPSGANFALDGVIGGGFGNTVNGDYATIAGGDGNLASGYMASVPGGYHNDAAGAFSFAAGWAAVAAARGSFVWSDYSAGAPHVAASVANEFVARASGGFALYSNAGLTSGVKLAPGSGTWSSLSDRRMKTGVVPLDDRAVLAKVSALPVSEWSYTSERGVRHMGPMAQDFYAAFRVGEDDRHITSIDEDGVALAAIKALNRENGTLRARLAATNGRLRATNGRLSAVNGRLTALEAEVALLSRARRP